MIMFDEHPFEAQERRRRASAATLTRFGGKTLTAVQPTATKAEAVIRPIEQTCRHCAQRERLGGSSLCVSCLDMKIRREGEEREFRKNLRTFAIISAVIVALMIALGGWMNPSEVQTTESQNSATQGK